MAVAMSVAISMTVPVAVCMPITIRVAVLTHRHGRAAAQGRLGSAELQRNLRRPASETRGDHQLLDGADRLDALELSDGLRHRPISRGDGRFSKTTA
jgi:hypothetical protein